MSYRVEIATTARAGCSATDCKKQAIKIAKGELRQGTLVQIQEHQSMKWRHWGCVTPQVLHNWKESSGGDMEMIDGYDELPADAQAKVARALEQEHVDDEDWKGDLSMNRFGAGTGMFEKGKAKKNKKTTEADVDDDGDGKETPKAKKPTKKRGRKAAEEDNEIAEEPVAKKPRGKKVKDEKAEDANHDKAPASTKSSKPKKGKSKPTPQDDDDENDGGVNDGEAVDHKRPVFRKVPSKKDSKETASKGPEVDASQPRRKGRSKKTKATDED